jgi:hypothetical protein
MSFQVKHDPDANLDYGCDWSDWLPTGATIATSVWTVTPTGPILSADSKSTTATVVWVSGGTAGMVYTLTNRITDSASRVDDRSITLVCMER